MKYITTILLLFLTSCSNPSVPAYIAKVGQSGCPGGAACHGHTAINLDDTIYTFNFLYGKYESRILVKNVDGGRVSDWSIAITGPDAIVIYNGRSHIQRHFYGIKYEYDETGKTKK